MACRRLTVLIKALNEERHIAACLDSVLLAIAGLDAEVVLVDSCSSDRTIEIARRYPIRIVQFSHVEDRGCGAAVQLGYQVSLGEFVYVLDADMQLDPAFLQQALQRLAQDPGLAGVGGRLVDLAQRTESDRRRARAAAALQAEHEVHELGGGGLYRRAAIEQVGYLANRWLQACEEADLGVRLRAAGWRLLRLPDRAVMHEGHLEGTAAALRRLWRNRRAHAAGVFLRDSLGKPWWWLAVSRQRHIFIAPALHGAGLVLALAFGARYEALPLLGYWVAQSLRRRSMSSGAWSLIAAHVLFIASLIGFLRRPCDPLVSIESHALAADANQPS